MKKLIPEQRKALEILAKQTRDVNQRNRACVILARDDGHNPETISMILRISLSSVYDYFKDYDLRNKTKNNRHTGSSGKLDATQEQEIKKHLSEFTYHTAKAICAYIEARYQITYTPSGMLDWLHRNEFAYKAPKTIPGKLDPEKQAECIARYNKLKSTLQDNEVIMFMDAVHPEHQSQSISGWIPKKEIKTIGTTAKQYRLHINGAINLQNHQVFTQEYETIDSQSIISFLNYLENTVEAKKIHIICDNGRSNKNKELSVYLEGHHKFQLHYLSPYSPNLNPIERLWKIMREHVTYNKTYQTFADFSNAIREFFIITVNDIKDKLKKRINDKFEAIVPNPIQVAT